MGKQARKTKSQCGQIPENVDKTVQREAGEADGSRNTDRTIPQPTIPNIKPTSKQSLCNPPTMNTSTCIKTNNEHPQF